MSDSGARRYGRSLGRIGPIAGVAFVAGVYFGMTSHRTLEPLIKPAAALVVVLAGVLILFSFAAVGSTSDNDDVRKFRVQMSAAGAGQIVFGVAQLIPSEAISLVLGGLSVLVMMAALRGIPKRFFALGL